MPLATSATTTNGGRGGGADSRRMATGPMLIGRKRELPWIVAGVLLVLGCALAFGVASLRAQHPERVLAVAHPLAAGQLIEPEDLTVARLSSAHGLRTVAASAESTVLGRPAAVGLVPGALLTPAEVGSPAPTAGRDVVAVALKAGSYPPALGSGAHVDVVDVNGSVANASANAFSSRTGTGSSEVGPKGVLGTGPGGAVPAIVEAVTGAPPASSVAAVVTLEVAPVVATDVAMLAATNRVALVEVPAGTGK